MDVFNLKITNRVHLYMEVAESFCELPTITTSTCLLFFKFYDPKMERMHITGSCITSLDEKISTLMPLMRKSLDLDPDTRIIMHEEVKSTMIELLNPDVTVRQAELICGDIIIFEHELSESEKKHYRFPSCVDYYKYVRTRVMVRLYPLNIPGTETTVLFLDRDMDYDQVLTSVAQVLGVQPLAVKLFSVTNKTQFEGTEKLKNMITLELMQLSHANYAILFDLVK
jgi:hypothetical protein